jgi:hypothetical protein
MRLAKLATFLLLLLGLLGPVGADYSFSDKNWAIEGRFPDAPKTDGILTPSPQGDVKVQRFYWEPGTEHYLLARFEYPLALPPGREAATYERAFGDLLKSRTGQVKSRGQFTLGPYIGETMVISQRREKSLREVRFVQIGAILYLASAEWPERGDGATRAVAFFASLQVRPEFQDARAAAEAGRWRELAAGRFRLRYDATRWYRDPADAEAGVFNLLRPDQRAEAQFITETHAVESGDIEAAVLTTAREGADSVNVTKRSRKRRGDVDVIELEFEARVEGTTYCNHGYFYSGNEGTVQLRAWSAAGDYPGVEGDITELLDGLIVTAAGLQTADPRR